MELGDDHIKDLFSSKLSHFEPELPSSVWDKIEANLPKAAPVVIVPKPISQNKIVKFGIWLSGVAAMIIAILFLLPRQEESVKSNLSTQAPSLDSLSLKKKDLYKNPILAQVPLLLDKEYHKTNNTQQASSLMKTQEKNLDRPDNQTPVQNNKFSTRVLSLSNPLNFSTKTIDEISSIDISASNDVERKIAAFEAEGDRQKNLLAYTDKIDNKYENNLQLGVNGGSSVTTASQFKDDFNSIYSSSTSVTTRSTEAKMKHNQPVTFGLSISKQINKDLSIESGINYTYLSSRLGAEETDRYSQNEMQYLHYLGIPLTLNYTFARWNKFNFYSSLGVMIQKDFYGRESRRAFLDGLNSEYYAKHKISQKNPQFSTNAGLGASFPLYDRLRLYTTIGAAYYFDANNQYQTIYSDKKWLFNLNIGLRFEF